MNSRLGFLFVELCAVITCNSATSIDQLLVETVPGWVEGITVASRTGKSVRAFLGIPYAEAPTGQNRFSPPQELQPWSNTYSAKSKPPACTQGKLVIYKNESEAFWNTNHAQSEDCLYLNIWIPETSEAHPLSVLVWIHGGGFQTGSASQELYDGSTLASEQDIIVVSLNYRLSFLGFLYLDHPEAPGNVGLMDQISALGWIRRNIPYFGGDPEKITVSGESAGGVSVGFLCQVEPSLFKRGIMQSGLPTGPRTPKEKALATYLEFAKNLDCGLDRLLDTGEVIRCLKTKTTSEIQSFQLSMPQTYQFWPVIDGTFMKNPNPLLREAQKQDSVEKDLLIGTTSADGACDLQLFLPEIAWTDGTVYSRSDMAKVIKMTTGSDSELVSHAVMFNYIDWEDPDNLEHLRSGIMDLTTDEIVCPTNQFSDRLVANGHRVYKYVFDAKPSTSSFPKWTGSLHGDELPYLFGAPLNPSNGYDFVDQGLSKTLMHYWGNFVKYGDPNGVCKELLGWPRYTQLFKQTLVIGAELRVKKGHRLRACAFRRHLLPKLLAEQKSHPSLGKCENKVLASHESKKEHNWLKKEGPCPGQNKMHNKNT